MKFWESIKLGMGLSNKGIAPTGLVVDKFVLGGGPLKVEWKSVSEITNDEVRIARLLGDTFLEKRIMDRHIEGETAPYVLESIKDLLNILRDVIDKFSGSISEIDRFYGTVLVYWKVVAKTAKDKLEEAITVEEQDRAAYQQGHLIEAADIARARDSLGNILFQFRKDSYPIIKILIDLLPENNLIAVEAKRKLAPMKAQLEEHFGNSGEAFLEPEWTVDI